MRETPGNQLHHKDFWMQRAFQEQAQNFVEIINQMGNPFLHDSTGLLKLDTWDTLHECVVITVRCVKKLGMELGELGI